MTKAVLIINLLEPVAALVVVPLDEDGSLVYPRAVAAVRRAVVRPAFQAFEGRRERRDGGAVPAEIPLGAVCSNANTLALIAGVVVATDPVLSGDFHAEHPDGAHEVEFGAADIGICGFVSIGVFAGRNLHQSIDKPCLSWRQGRGARYLCRVRRDLIKAHGRTFRGRQVEVRMHRATPDL